MDAMCLFKNKKSDSQFANHLIEKGYTVDPAKGSEQLHLVSKGFKTNILEQLEILKHSNLDTTLINEQISLHKSPLLNIFKYNKK